MESRRGRRRLSGSDPKSAAQAPRPRRMKSEQTGRQMSMRTCTAPRFAKLDYRFHRRRTPHRGRRRYGGRRTRGGRARGRHPGDDAGRLRRCHPSLDRSGAALPAAGPRPAGQDAGRDGAGHGRVPGGRGRRARWWAWSWAPTTGAGAGSTGWRWRPAYRRRGIAGRLVREVERRVEALGIEIVAALIESDNEASLAFFQAIDYLHAPRRRVRQQAALGRHLERPAAPAAYSRRRPRRRATPWAARCAGDRARRCGTACSACRPPSGRSSLRSARRCRAAR